MERFSSFNEAIPHAYTISDLVAMDDAELVATINQEPNWEPELVEDLIWRAFPDYSEPWGVGDSICYQAAEKLGLHLD